MQFAQRTSAAGKSEVCWVFGPGSIQLHFAAAVRQHTLELCLGHVDGFAGCGSFLFGQGAKLLHQGCEFPICPKVIHPRLFQRPGLGRIAQLCQSRLLEWFNLIQQRHTQQEWRIRIGGRRTTENTLLSAVAADAKRL
jgi:hypothetical protein